MQLFFGFVGLFNVLFSWPIGVLLHFARIERFELPVSSRVVVALLISVRSCSFRPIDLRKLTETQSFLTDGNYAVE